MTPGQLGVLMEEHAAMHDPEGTNSSRGHQARARKPTRYDDPAELLALASASNA